MKLSKKPKYAIGQGWDGPCLLSTARLEMGIEAVPCWLPPELVTPEYTRFVLDYLQPEVVGSGGANLRARNALCATGDVLLDAESCIAGWNDHVLPQTRVDCWNRAVARWNLDQEWTGLQRNSSAAPHKHNLTPQEREPKPVG